MNLKPTNYAVASRRLAAKAYSSVAGVWIANNARATGKFGRPKRWVLKKSGSAASRSLVAFQLFTSIVRSPPCLCH